MTLDETIKHAEEVADSHDRIKQIKAVTLEECRRAREHRQLAEWLKELQAHREAWMKVVSAIDQHTDIHSDGEFYIKNFDVKKIIAEYRPKEVQDADSN